MFRKLFAIETAALLRQDDDSRLGDAGTATGVSGHAERATGFPPGLGVWNPRAC